MIRLENIKPGLMLSSTDLRSENAAHRIAVLWTVKESDTSRTKECRRSRVCTSSTACVRMCFGLACLVVWAMPLAGCAFHSGFTDRALEEKLRANESDFNKLIDMLRQDSGLSVITPRNAFADHGIPATTSRERLAEYRKLLATLQLKSISRTAGGGTNRVFFAIWQKQAFPMGGTNEYFVYAETPPAESKYIFQSLDHLRRQTDAYGFKKIAERWYLHVDNW